MHSLPLHTFLFSDQCVHAAIVLRPRLFTTHAHYIVSLVCANQCRMVFVAGRATIPVLEEICANMHGKQYVGMSHEYNYIPYKQLASVAHEFISGRITEHLTSRADTRHDEQHRFTTAC